MSKQPYVTVEGLGPPGACNTGRPDRSCDPTLRLGPGRHFILTAPGGHTHDPHFTDGRQVSGLLTSKPPRVVGLPRSGDECAVWSRGLSQLGPAAQSLAGGAQPLLCPLQGTEPEAPPRPGSLWDNCGGTPGSCRASSVASRRGLASLSLSFLSWKVDNQPMLLARVGLGRADEGARSSVATVRPAT